MQTPKTLLTALICALLAFGPSACSDDPKLPDGSQGSIEDVDGGAVTVFHLTALPGEDVSDEDVTFTLTDPETRVNLRFKGSVVPAPDLDILGRRGALTCRMRLGSSQIPDGKYFLTISGAKAALTSPRLVRFRSSIGSEEDYSLTTYDDLEGEGTELSPYIIAGPGDFLIFLSYLSDDELHGYGRYFKITRSFTVPRRSEIIDGRTWASTYFQGTLDGGGHTLRDMAYTGGSNATTDSGIGLFLGLFNATVSNLKISDAMIGNVVSDIGLLAGTAEGDNSISNVTVDGTISASGSAVGGLIGRARDNLTLSNVTLGRLAITADTDAGCVLGFFSDGSLSVNGVSTPGHIFSVTGNSNIGGAVGSIRAAEKVVLSGITLEHSVDTESSDVKVVYAKNSNAGGLVGYWRNDFDAEVVNSTVKCPVRTDGDNAGAMFGAAEINSSFSIEKVLLASVVKGRDNVGGYFGRVKICNPSAQIAFTGDDNGSRFVVKQSASAGVEGRSNIGALAGLMEADGGYVLVHSLLEIAVNVSGTNDNVGGAVGYLHGLSSSRPVDFEIDDLNFSSESMRVSGGGDAVGGVFGRAEGALITGPNRIETEKAVPAAKNIITSFNGVVSGLRSVGGVVGILNAQLRGVASGAKITATSAGSDTSGAGGVAGYSYSSLSQCAFTGSVTGPDAVGGILGRGIYGITIDNCVNHADITGGKNQGGIAGEVGGYYYAETLLRSCVNYGDLTDGACVGGIVARIKYRDDCDFNDPESYTIIERCGNFGRIRAKGDSDSSVGGIVGRLEGFYCRLSSCANHGDITSTTVQYTIGGVAGEMGGRNDSHCRVEYCMNEGSISCDVASTKLGGIVGHLHSGNITANNVIRDCYNIGPIPADQKDDTGGILGLATSYTDIYRTWNRGKISHGNAIIGTHSGASLFDHSHNYYLEGTGGSWPSSTSVSQSKASEESTFKTFDFDKVWDITSAGPALQDCPFQYATPL